MLKTIKLYGELAEKYGKEWKFDIDTPIEAVGALMANNPGFKQFMMESESRGVGYQVVVGKTYIKEEADLIIGREVPIIKIIPTVLGAKSAIGRIIVGAVMIALYVYCGACATAIGAQGSFGYSVYMAVATNLIISGVVELISPGPSEPEYADTSISSFTFSGASNTVKQGVAIPVCYGQLMVGGAVISAGIHTERFIP